MRLSQAAVVVLVAALGQSVAQADVSDPARPAWVVSLIGDRLTVHLDKAPLRLVLAELAQQGGFRLHLSERLDTPVISARFERLPLDEAIGRLLAGWSYAVIYAPSPVEQGRSAMRISEVVLFDAAGSPNEGLRDGHAPDSTVALESPGPQERLQALEQWVATQDGSDVDPLTHALLDPDEQVRARAQELVEHVWAAKAAETSR
jgi:hypothetical protein